MPAMTAALEPLASPPQAPAPALPLPPGRSRPFGVATSPLALLLVLALVGSVVLAPPDALGGAHALLLAPLHAGERSVLGASAASAGPTHIVFTLCGGARGGSRTAGSPGPTAVKSVLLSALMQRDDADVAAGLSGRVHLHLVMDNETAGEWAESSNGGGGPFRDAAAMLQRHPGVFEASLYAPEEIWRMARRSLQAEARERGLDETSLTAADLDENAWKQCAGLRMLYPMAFAALERFTYLDFDTVVLCDAARLGALFNAFEGAAVFGFAGEDPSGGSWPTWYTGNKLPVGVPGGINTGVMLVDARKLGRTYSFRRYWAEVTRIVGEGIYHPVHGKYYGTADLPSLGDQDILNVLFYDDASLLHLLPSRWNTLQPAGRIRQSAPDFVPMPPCIMHFSAETYAAPKDVNRLGNGAFRFVSDWEA